MYIYIYIYIYTYISTFDISSTQFPTGIKSLSNSDSNRYNFPELLRFYFETKVTAPWFSFGVDSLSFSLSRGPRGKLWSHWLIPAIMCQSRHFGGWEPQ